MSSSPEVDVPAVPAPRRVATNAILFALTVVSVFHTGAVHELAQSGGVASNILEGFRHIHKGWTFAVPLLAILLTHEFGHYFAAMIHRVPASLPYFIPLPFVGLFGTMGAVISMPARIRTRNALLDIGAAGPLAGIIVAIPVLAYGLSQSPVNEIPEHSMLEGQCLLYSLIKRVVIGPIPEGHDVFINGTAFAGWVGLLITMLNLIPVGQLDGGHIAYALFGERHNKNASYIHFGLLAVFLYNLLRYGDLTTGAVWLVWFGLLALLRRMTGGVWHPPTDLGETLSGGRRAVAVLCLVLWVVLFMPTPWLVN
jgi:membrane-associated protease RseP (regulator of RpoE activity)